MRDLKEFNPIKNVIQNRDSVLVIASSGFPENGNEDYYIHMLVKTLNSGDTINVLVPPSGMDAHNTKIKTFIGPSDVFFRPKEKFQPKVFSNPYFINIDWSKYPSTIGQLNTLTQLGDKGIDELVDDAIKSITAP